MLTYWKILPLIVRCFAGLLAEIVFACDRSYILSGQFEGDNRPVATLRLSSSNFGRFPMSNDLSRLATRFLGEPESVEHARDAIGRSLDAEQCEKLGLVTFAFDDIDWQDEVRIFLEERASFAPEAMAGLEVDNTEEPFIHHFPDGNASVVRRLFR